MKRGKHAVTRAQDRTADLYDVPKFYIMCVCVEPSGEIILLKPVSTVFDL